MARIRLVLRQFAFFCLSLFITSSVFCEIFSRLYNIKISGESVAASLSESIIPLTVLSKPDANFPTENTTQYISLHSEVGPRLKNYQPIALLDIKPAVLKPIQANLSAMFDDVPHLEINCLLMINEYGDVDKILFGDNNLSEKHRSELEQLFLQLRFTPGYLHDQAVPTVMRIAISI